MSSPQKKAYSDSANVLSVLSTFAAGIAVATQFTSPCSDAKLQALLSTASELFLASLFALFIVFLLLYGFSDEDPIGLGRHDIVVANLVWVGLILIAGFMFLGGAIVAAGNVVLGIAGLVVLAVLAAAAAVVGCYICDQSVSDYEQVPVGANPPLRNHVIPADIGEHQISWLWGFFWLEIIGGVALVVLGIWQAISPLQNESLNHCKPTTTTFAVSEINQETISWPTSTIPVSVVNQETDTLLSITDIDTVLSITDLDTVLPVTDIDTFLTITLTLLTVTITDPDPTDSTSSATPTSSTPPPPISSSSSLTSTPPTSSTGSGSTSPASPSSSKPSLQILPFRVQ